MKHEQAVIFQENRRITNVLRIAEHVLLYMYKLGITGKWSERSVERKGLEAKSIGRGIGMKKRAAAGSAIL